MVIEQNDLRGACERHVGVVDPALEHGLLLLRLARNVRCRVVVSTAVDVTQYVDISYAKRSHYTRIHSRDNFC